ncbi:hypothetical protein DPMN_003260 [Dreissena polymorpha]|uniref:Uncharacterized protein n=1 Tax=Dreissena polymorpha TaxID=45954 RepID=A0A9D4RUM0_DREPO|nr:hypothetical protein DPMN_003260 [Dreissena polymorpha]
MTGQEFQLAEQTPYPLSTFKHPNNRDHTQDLQPAKQTQYPLSTFKHPNNRDHTQDLQLTKQTQYPLSTFKHPNNRDHTQDLQLAKQTQYPLSTFKHPNNRDHTQDLQLTKQTQYPLSTFILVAFVADRKNTLTIGITLRTSSLLSRHDILCQLSYLLPLWLIDLQPAKQAPYPLSAFRKKWDIELTPTYLEYRDIRCRDNESGPQSRKQTNADRFFYI